MDDFSKATEAASLASRFDQLGEVDKAIECYTTAARLHERVLAQIQPEEQTGIRDKIEEYLARASALQEQLDVTQDESKRVMEHSNSLLQQALDADESGLTDQALELYIQMVEFAIKVKTSDAGTKQKINNWAKQAMDRAEKLKGVKKMGALSINEPSRSAPNQANLQREQSVHLKVTGKYKYTDEEKVVLFCTSKINNNDFLPFTDEDVSEEFTKTKKTTEPFEDIESKLQLSSKQQSELDRWVRPKDICTDPQLIVGNYVDCLSIKQTIVSDCSLVASLIVSALYEQKFKRDVITSIIYPKNENKVPIYNPSGKYMVKLHLNGIRRRIIVDDRLPYGKNGHLLCSHSSNKNEFWVSILEKAYLKVMGGYDFPGSNSNIDLHALTGWIPERCAIRKDEADFNADALFERMRVSLERGEVLATVATGNLPDTEVVRTGLVATHAYAVLDILKVNGEKLLKLKNPWSHLRWKGNYSELDTVHWTPSLKALLGYNPENAAQHDNGVFWIDYNSILNFFDVFYLNWNPAKFKFTYCIHQKWDADVGPMKDSCSIGDNPQYSLHVQGKGSVWLLLTRHITQIDDFKDNKEFITLLVYKKNRRRVYYPDDPRLHIGGIPINSPHYLCIVKVDEGSTDRYTLVVSRYEKTRTILYTLRAYSNCPFTLNKLEPYPYTKHWRGPSAGGCEHYYPQTYSNKPKYAVTVPKGRGSCRVTMELRAPKEFKVCIDVRVEALSDPAVTAPFLRKSSGPYRWRGVMEKSGGYYEHRMQYERNKLLKLLNYFQGYSVIDHRLTDETAGSIFTRFGK